MPTRTFLVICAAIATLAIAFLDKIDQALGGSPAWSFLLIGAAIAYFCIRNYRKGVI